MDTGREVMSLIAVAVGIVLAVYVIGATTWKWKKESVFSYGGSVLCATGIVLIGLSIWGTATIHVSPTEGIRAQFNAKTEQDFGRLVRSLERVVAALDSGGRDTAMSPAGGRTAGGRTEDLTSTPSIIAGRTVYPYMSGWTVLCDASTNHDPQREIPNDRVDWNAILHDSIQRDSRALNPLTFDGAAATLITARPCVSARRVGGTPTGLSKRMSSFLTASPGRPG